MRARLWAGILAGILLSTLLFAQRPRRWAQYEPEMQDPVEDPPDAWEPAEFAFGRLRYRSGGFGGRGFYRSRWGIDANKCDRLFAQGLRRLTRVNTRSVEQIVDIDSDDIFDWPWMYAVGPGAWRFSESQVERLRQFFARGGFLMVDDFHGEYEWAGFMDGIERVLPGRRVIEFDGEEPILHTVYNLREREHVPGFQIIRGQPWERGGVGEHWRAIVDENDRVQVAICFNMDIGDAIEWADYPPYPERHSYMAFKVLVNYVVYAMTH